MPRDSNSDPTENNVIKPFGRITNASLPNIIREFNLENDSVLRPSILKNLNFLGFSLFRHRMLAKDQLRLVQRNGVPELAGHSGHFQRRIKIWFLLKPWTWFRVLRDDSSTVGIYSIAEIIEKGHIGYGDRHLVTVNATDYAKVMVDGEALLLEEGAYVIKTSNFSYMGKVAQSTPRIKHGDLLRIIPPPKTVAVYKIGSVQHVYPDTEAVSSSTKETIGKINQNGILEIRHPNAEFITFLDTNLINKNYPTEKAQFTYYTKDSVQVGVKLFVAYQIIDPKLAIEKLGPTGIDKHIEHVTHVDMARAGQETSLQGIQSSSDLNIDATAGTLESSNDTPPAYHQIYLSTWQESVKKQLEKDLKEYGILLVRLNIEEINILNKDVENEMGKQAVEVAKANADLAAIQMQREVALQKAHSDTAVARLNAQQHAESNLILAENNKKVAELDKETTRINAEAQAQALQLLGDQLAANSSLLQYELNKGACKAIAETQIHSLFFGDGKNSPLFINNQMGILPTKEASNSLTNT
ncbi:MAG: hypothetical protein E6K54_02825 [Gammaproteobacteria bacterium]|nr:MAG: hypothetical protein E6K54_02825 [Gammaproteobacteria bacterium]